MEAGEIVARARSPQECREDRLSRSDREGADDLVERTRSATHLTTAAM